MNLGSDNITITSIKVDNVDSMEKAEKKIQRLQELTKNNFHNFIFYACASCGSFDLWVSSTYDFEEADKENALLEVFSFALMALV